MIPVNTVQARTKHMQIVTWMKGQFCWLHNYYFNYGGTIKLYVYILIELISQLPSKAWRWCHIKYVWHGMCLFLFYFVLFCYCLCLFREGQRKRGPKGGDGLTPRLLKWGGFWEAWALQKRVQGNKYKNRIKSPPQQPITKVKKPVHMEI